MIATWSRLRAYAELGRVSNLPTCVSNTLVGVALGITGNVYPWEAASTVAIAVCMMYYGGMAMNDVLDVRIDYKQSPQRPLPSDRLSLEFVRWMVGGCFAVALAFLSTRDALAVNAGLLLSICVMAYNLYHKESPTSVIFMGACRALIYVIAGAAVAGEGSIARSAPLAVVLGLYTVLFTVIARSEKQQGVGGVKWLSLLLPVVALAPMLTRFRFWDVQTYLAAALLLAWLAWAATDVLRKEARTRSAVMKWIAGFCLMDAFFLAALDRPQPAYAALACFVLTVLSHRRVAGT